MNASPQIEIRPATPADADLVVTMLLELAVHEDSVLFVRSTAAQWRTMLLRSDVIVLLAFRDSNPVGFVSAVRELNLWLGKDVVALDDLYVRESARNQRVGEALMRELANRVADEQLTIRWGVNPSNEAGQRFYQRLGATLAPKVNATWRPEAYMNGVVDLSQREATVALSGKEVGLGDDDTPR